MGGAAQNMSTADMIVDISVENQIETEDMGI
jgi:hypothetical protein